MRGIAGRSSLRPQACFEANRRQAALGPRCPSPTKLRILKSTHTRRAGACSRHVFGRFVNRPYGCGGKNRRAVVVAGHLGPRAALRRLASKHACGRRPGRPEKRPSPKAVAHRDLYAPKRFFSRNTASKSHGRRQPCRGSFLCLAEKPIVLECFAVLNGRFFSAATSALAEILCVFQKSRRKLRGKRFIQNRVNPYAHPPKRCLFAYFIKLFSARRRISELLSQRHSSRISVDSIL